MVTSLRPHTYQQVALYGYLNIGGRGKSNSTRTDRALIAALSRAEILNLSLL
jgi:hypothetical protein